MADLLLGPQDLAAYMRAGKRTEEGLEQTAVFVEAVMEAAAAAAAQAGGSVSLKRAGRSPHDNPQDLDLASVTVASGLPVTGNGQSLELRVVIAPRLLFWGLYVWGTSSVAEAIRDAAGLAEMPQSDQQEWVGNGAIGAPEGSWDTGAYWACGKSLAPEQLEQEGDLSDLAGMIGTDLARWYLHTAPLVANLRARLEEPQAPATWIFQCRPDRYDLDDMLAHKTVDDWSVRRYEKEVRVGDRVLFWRAGGNPGIYGLGAVDSEPYDRPERGDKAVDVRVHGRLAAPIMAQALQDHPVLSGMHIMKQRQGTNFRVTPDEWAVLEPMLGEVIPPVPGRRYWRISAGAKGSMWDEFRRRGVVSVGGWGVAHFDLREVSPGSKEELRAGLLERAGGDLKGRPLSDLWDFYSSMAEGDWVFGYGEGHVLGWGTVEGEYSYDGFGSGPVHAQWAWHTRAMQWQPEGPVPTTGLSPGLRARLGRNQTIIELSQTEAEEIKMALLPNDDPMTTITQSLNAAGLSFTRWQIATFYTALQTKGFVILSGISGTGKTKLAQHFAAMLPQPAGEAATPDALSVTVRPSVLEYGHIIIPKRAALLFTPLAPNSTIEVPVRLPDASEVCRVGRVVAGNTDVVRLGLRGAVRRRFAELYQAGDTLPIALDVDDDGALAAIGLGAEQATPDLGRVAPGGHNHLFVPVRPDWRDSKGLLGYYNPLDQTYAWTEFLRFLMRASRSYREGDGLAWFVLLDEMNLAHVEHYFADLLSVLESGRDEDGWTREGLRLDYPDDAEGDLPPRELRLPPNLYIVGTVNVDETTYAFSPKVVDRAFTLEFTQVDFARYLLSATGEALLMDDQRRSLLEGFTSGGAFAVVRKKSIAQYLAASPEVRVRLQGLNAQLVPSGLQFGYRVFDEIVTFLGAARHNKVFDNLGEEAGEDPAFDAALLMKVLPKFHGSRGKLLDPLCALLAWCLDPDTVDIAAIRGKLDADSSSAHDAASKLAGMGYRYPMTAQRAVRMVRDLLTDGFAAFG